jgi:hypothetical protein
MFNTAEPGHPLSGTDVASRSERPLAIALVTIVFAWSIVFAVTLIVGRPADDTAHALRAAAEITTTVVK